MVKTINFVWDLKACTNTFAGNKRQNKNVKCFVSLLLFSPFFALFIIIQDRTIFIVQQSIYLANIVPYYGALCFNNNNKWQKLLYIHKKIKEIYIFEHFLHVLRRIWSTDLSSLALHSERDLCVHVLAYEKPRK